MDLLEHQFEAVAFRLYSLPEASAATGAAAWTCLAAVLAAAAAAGLWRLRASSGPTNSVADAAMKPPELDPPPAEELTTAPSRAPERWPEPAAASTVPPSPKERYTAYYRDAGACRVGCCGDAGDEYARGDDDREDEAEEPDGGSVAYRTPSEVTGNFGGWEEEVVWSSLLPLTPTAAYRSPTALGGSVNVVQLWDQVAGGGLTPTASPRRRRNRGVVAAAPGF